MNNDFAELKTLMTQYRQRVDRALERYLPQSTIHPARLHEAMRYAVFNGGKRIRPILTYATATALGINLSDADGPACAIELIHAYSLVHDDLPAMDDDDLRRGQPSCHRAYDEATAILVGDGLQTLAFHILAHGQASQFDAQQRIKMIELLALAAGSRGMVGGQAIDLSVVGQDLDMALLEDMHIHKTGALIRASVMLGAHATISGITDDIWHKLDHYAKCIGLAFQIQDDILDIEAPTQSLGKTQGADQARNKPTYPSLLGLDGAKQRAAELRENALDSLTALDERAQPLRWLANFIVQRCH